MYNAGIIGATGYTGVALISILQGHPEVKINLITSNTYKGQRVSAIFPALKGLFEETLVPTDDDHRGKCDIYLLCLPHGKSMEVAKALYDEKAIIIDLSADFRFEDIRLYEDTYVKHIAPELIDKTAYGLPELYRERIKRARLIGNPGCYPTSAILGLYPLLKEGLVSADIIIDSKSGVSGAGREAKLANLFCEVAEGFKAYGIGVHRHEPEIQKEVKKYQDIKVTFTPHLLPMNRGILSTIYTKINKGITTKMLLSMYRTIYREEPFIRLMDEGQFPDTHFVRYSNYCDIGIKAFDDGRIIIITAIDNLVKGASGQAIQNMNITLGLKETTGLTGLPYYP
jgi:N-acetyl-gamma-glutamyl-phosphate reductase